MSEAHEIVAAMKRDNLKSSFEIALPILSPEKQQIGRLVPVGGWILAEADIIEAITAWRQRWARMFFSQFEATAERTTQYLRNLVIASPDRLLFLIYTADGTLVGHTGLMKIAGLYVDLDNVVRGISGGHPRLMPLAAMALLDWCFKSLGAADADGRVMSYNRPIITLLKQIGFEPAETIPLLKRLDGDTVFHDFAEQEQSNVEYHCIRLSLKKDQFYKKFGWLQS